MARNPASLYGTDLACYRDATPLFSSVTGIEVVRQHAFHRLTADSVLGPGGDGWGFDCRRLAGAKRSALAGLQPVLSEVLQRDERILAADVKITETSTRGFSDVRIEARCLTEEGPFELIFNVSELTSAVIEGQGAA